MEKVTAYSDEQLIGLAQKGDAHAYNQLLSRYRDIIRHIIYFHINNQANVNDLTQEVLLKVYRYLPTFKDESKFSTWLYRITQNTVKNYYRTLDQQLESESQFAGDHYQSSGYSPEYMLITMEFNEKIESAISKLSQELRTCYGMHTFEGQTYEDIAKKMKCPIGTVRSRIFRARKLLISSLSGYTG